VEPMRAMVFCSVIVGYEGVLLSSIATESLISIIGVVRVLNSRPLTLLPTRVSEGWVWYVM